MIFVKRGLSSKSSMFVLAAIASMAGSLISASANANEIEEVTAVSSLFEDQDSIGQVTSVSQLSDVQPTDWAFQAFQSFFVAAVLHSHLALKSLRNLRCGNHLPRGRRRSTVLSETKELGSGVRSQESGRRG